MVEKRETRQKSAIEELISKSNKFFTAEEVYSQLKKKNPKIVIATVYRFLNELQKDRIVHIYSCERKKLYSKKEMSHSHFICEFCGIKKHLEIKKIDFLKNFVSVDICHVQIEINGICVDCKTKLNLYK